jgi:hypothetical protein
MRTRSWRGARRASCLNDKIGRGGRRGGIKDVRGCGNVGARLVHRPETWSKDRENNDFGGENCSVESQGSQKGRRASFLGRGYVAPENEKFEQTG